MDIKNDFKNGFKLAADAATDIAQALIDKSRLRAKANRIKQVIKGDTELRNQAYIELGRYFYDNLRESSNSEQEALCVVVDKTTARIDKASRKYIELLNQSGEIKLESDSGEKIKQIVTSKAIEIKDSASEKVSDIKDKAKNKAVDLGSKAKDKATDLGNKAKDKAEKLSNIAKEKTQDLTAKAKETVADFTDKAKDKVDDFKSFIAPEELDDIDDIINDDEQLSEMISQQEEIIAQAQKNDSEDTPKDCDDEESPQDFTF